MEEWKPIKDFERYHISKYGYIKNIIKGNILSNVKNHNGYLVVHLFNDKEDKILRVNRLVALHFCDNVDNLDDVNHEDGIKINNFYKNLKWCTKSYNMQHALTTGLVIREEGENATGAKLSTAIVLYIFRQKGIIEPKVTAKELNISRTLVTLIQGGKHRTKEIEENISLEEITSIKSRNVMNIKPSRKVFQIDNNGKILKEYTINSLAKTYNITTSYASEIVRGKKGKTLKEKFMYEKDYIEKFSDEQALNRDLTTERKILEGEDNIGTIKQ